MTELNLKEEVEAILNSHKLDSTIGAYIYEQYVAQITTLIERAVLEDRQKQLFKEARKNERLDIRRVRFDDLGSYRPSKEVRKLDDQKLKWNKENVSKLTLADYQLINLYDEKLAEELWQICLDFNVERKFLNPTVEGE